MSSGLHNIGKVSSSDPLLIYLPPYWDALTETAPQVPSFLRRYPTAVINYRWYGFHPFEEVEPPKAEVQNSGDPEAPTLHNWPFPVHDTLNAYSWIVEHLAPSDSTRRDVYVYGSYLGASLATSLALTESHPHQRMAVRGCVAFNGIYNWTMFLPDHQINKKSGARAANVLEEILGQPTDPSFQDLKQHISSLFGEPSHLFDPFVSACLFFQTAGLLVPQDFDVSADPVATMLGSYAPAASEEAQEAIKSLLLVMADKPPRKSALAFPPRKSTLKLPDTLLLHTALPPLPAAFQRRRRKPVATNHFKTQADELAALMRRSLEKIELRDRSKWDHDLDEYLEVDRRVQLFNVGKDERPFEIPNYGEAVARDWLEDRMSR
ncbi:hypothetical protein PFICI_10129 [Pestalotiopsis fici W106-1]|uniref:Uncharacterized protein n=1 Tax=Pestalotiopsis fici (strain W106-1 / CGMCC3.15140) TaxID=1229662 RepID=W3WY40_PESFW|nr:uncharacterized protein PFICI_10129 [Pestalotiopsis fici W106-1]ETS78067.1 hypothetical protein PFICI_10129 [Pestalotiopsis fici W106-1]